MIGMYDKDTAGFTNQPYLYIVILFLHNMRYLSL